MQAKASVLPESPLFCWILRCIYCCISAVFPAVFLYVSSIMSIIITIKKPINAGIIHIPKADARTPKRGGMNVEPRYALAIWTPIMAWEFSAPKFTGVEWIIAG